MGKTKAQNLTRLEESLGGSEIEALNTLSPGLGAKIHKLFSNLGNIQAAQAGHSGTVVFAEQKKVDARGVALPVMKLQGQRIADAADAKDDQDYVTLRQVRALLTCEALADLFTDCPEAAEAIQSLTPPPDPPSSPTEGCVERFAAEQTIETGLADVYGVRVFNEYVYVAGSGPTFQVYRLKSNGAFVLLDSLTLSQEIRRFVLHGSFIFGCRDGAEGQNLISVDVGKPWSLAEADSLDVGFAAQGLDAQGSYCYVVGGNSDIAVVDISKPTAMLKVN